MASLSTGEVGVEFRTASQVALLMKGKGEDGWYDSIYSTWTVSCCNGLVFALLAVISSSCKLTQVQLLGVKLMCVCGETISSPKD